MGRAKKFTTAEMYNATEQLLLTTGYEGFTIGLVAEKLEVSRAAIYKYFTNKEALIVNFMVDRMVHFIDDIAAIPHTMPFQEQLSELLAVIFKSKDLHQVLSYVAIIDDREDAGIREKIQMLNELHVTMYTPLQAMIEKGKGEGFIKQQLPNELVLGFIFQSIAIPNHSKLNDEAFIEAMKEMICHGIFATK